ncbi:MAG TPA: outer membrane protein assembly factor BamA [Longimicrobiales bacterium]|nr:outer membrane protein assembly factor BamA [Longimicrobiales bacterium]
MIGVRSAAVLALAGVLLASPPLASAQAPGQPDGAPGAVEVAIESITVRGTERLATETVVQISGLAPGQRISYRGLQRAIRRLWESGLFADIDISGLPAQGAEQERLHLTLDVVEQPYVVQVMFEGLENLSESSVRDTLGFDGGSPYDPGRTALAEDFIRVGLAEKGIRLQSIEHELLPIADRPGENRLLFRVAEGSRVAIAEVEFRGNQVFEADALRGAIGTRAEGFVWFRDGRYDQDRLRQDLRERLPSFYGERGYIDMEVVADSLVVDPQSGKARLVITVEEGEQYRVLGFDVRGNRRFPTEDLARYYRASRGGLLGTLGLAGDAPIATEEHPVFDEVAFDAAVEAVWQLYRNEGYIYSQVNPIVDRTTLPDGSPAVSLAWEIVENNPAYVQHVQVAGNTHTHENVIRERLLVLPGDVYNEEALIRSMESISALGFFEAPLLPPDIQPDPQTGDIDIVFNVTERQTGSFNFGTALGGVSGVSGFLGYDEPNLFGQAKAGHLRWEFGRFSNNFEASYTDPSIRSSRVSGSVSFFNTSNRFFTFREGRVRRFGGSLRFGVPLPWDRWTRVFLGYALQETTYDQSSGVTTSLFSLPDGTQSTVSAGITRSTLNHPLFPTSGSEQRVTAEFSGGPFGGNGDFQKYSSQGEWWVPVAQFGGTAPGQRPVRFALGLGVEGGVLFGDASRFPFERFWMGGTQFGTSLRGYEENTITPLGYFTRNSSLINLEDRFGDAYVKVSGEFAMRFNDNISASAFYDAGNLWREPGQFDPSRLFRGAGLGLTLVTPFGPIGLDYAYGFDRTVPGWQLHFKLGNLR